MQEALVYRDDGGIEGDYDVTGMLQHLRIGDDGSMAFADVEGARELFYNDCDEATAHWAFEQLTPEIAGDTATDAGLRDQQDLLNAWDLNQPYLYPQVLIGGSPPPVGSAGEATESHRRSNRPGDSQVPRRPQRSDEPGQLELCSQRGFFAIPCVSNRLGRRADRWAGKEWPGTPMAVRRGRGQWIHSDPGSRPEDGRHVPWCDGFTVVSAGTGSGQNRYAWSPTTTLSSIIDGLSTTILLGESTLSGYAPANAGFIPLRTNWACPHPNYTSFMASDNVCGNGAGTGLCYSSKLGPSRIRRRIQARAMGHPGSLPTIRAIMRTSATASASRRRARSRTSTAGIPAGSMW